jgi:hypothetical protein
MGKGKEKGKWEGNLEIKQEGKKDYICMVV